MKLALPSLLLVLLAGCGGLPGDLRKQIASERDRLQPAERQVERAEKNVREEFVAGAPTSPEWSRQFRDARAKLASAHDKSEELRRLKHTGDHDSVLRAERLLSDERTLRQQATDEADKAEADASKWLDFERNPQHALAKMQSDYDAVRSVDLAPLESKVLKAEQDWPAKKPDLDRRLSSLKQIKEKAAMVSPNVSPQPPIATLIQNEEELSSEAATLSHDRQQLDAMSSQLYNAWDKILEDLDVTNGVFREKVKTVRTHFIDVADKKTETSSDVQWTDVSAPAYHAAEKDLGMAIAHKDAGLYDSEASSTAQPAGFAYIAPPSQGSNQYGYWTHNEGGSFWTFLPQYLIMRELLWGHSYQPVFANEYNGYYNAYRGGRTYYGQTTPASPPKYGTQGTVTQQHYASSRYVQSGGFKSSAYASHPSAPSAPPAAPSTRFGSAPEGSEGHRFGHGSESPSEGHRFGTGGGSPRPAPSGRRFGGGSRRR